MGRLPIRYFLLRLVPLLVLRRFFLDPAPPTALEFEEEEEFVHFPFTFFQFKAASEGSGAYLEYVPAIFSINPTGPNLGLLSCPVWLKTFLNASLDALF